MKEHMRVPNWKGPGDGRKRLLTVALKFGEKINFTNMVVVEFYYVYFCF